MTEEIWKPVTGLKDCEASNLGRIRVILEPYEISTGYHAVFVRHDGRSQSFLVHRLVAAAFHGLDLFNKKLFGMHIDDNRKNNVPENLRVGTVLDNVRDMISKGRNVNTRGSNVHCAKLTEKDVKVIRSLSKTFSPSELAEMYDVTLPTMLKAIKGDSWKHVE